MDWTVETARGLKWETLESRQLALFDEVRAAPERRYLLVSEPRPTFTCGRSGLMADLLWSSIEREARGVGIAQVTRGGKWTYHGPGQILVYPIARLAGLGYPSRAVHRYLGDLRAGVADFLSEQGLMPELSDSPFGVYVNRKKIASFGVAIQRGVSLHGVALYLEPQTPAFQGIHPCGVPGECFTSLSEEGVALPWEKAAERLASAVKKAFKRPKS